MADLEGKVKTWKKLCKTSAAGSTCKATVKTVKGLVGGLLNSWKAGQEAACKDTTLATTCNAVCNAGPPDGWSCTVDETWGVARLDCDIVPGLECCEEALGLIPEGECD